MLSTDRRILYPRLPKREREAVDMAFNQAMNVIRQAGFKTSGDDRAETLIGAISRYLIESNPELERRLKDTEIGREPTPGG